MEEKLKRIMADVFKLSIDQIDELSSMDKIEAWDSLKHIELITTIEDNFGIKLETEEILEMTNFSDIKHILSTKGI